MVNISFNSSRRSDGQPPPLIARLFGSVFFLVFAAAGCFFFYLILTDVILPEIKARSWVETPCEMVGDDEHPFQYRYRYEGQFYVSTRYEPSSEDIPEGSDGQVFLSRYPKGSEAICLVNPGNPHEAVFQTGSLGVGFFILIPILFMVIGFGGAYGTIRGGKGQKRKDGSRAPKSISNRAEGNMTGKLGGVAFGFVFFAAGSAFLWVSFLGPLFKTIAAKNWNAVPATVISSHVESHYDDDGTTYSVDILYRYTVHGREYRSNRYEFIGGSSSGRSGKTKVVAQYPAGREFTCWVDPDDPAEAVIKRTLGGMAWFGLIPLIFIVIGLAVMIASLRSGKGGGALSSGAKRKKGKGTPTRMDRRVRDPKALRKANNARVRNLADGGIELKPGTGRWGKVFGIIFMAAFWNGIVSVFLVQVVKGFQSGSPEWFLTIFMIPFVLIGLGLIIAIPWTLLALTNPVPKLIVDQDAIPLGGTLALRWALEGKPDRIKTFSLRLAGTESATYSRGTDTVTDTSEFLSIPILETSEASRMADGRTELEIPISTMHSFESSNNKVVWSIELTADIPKWPDIKASFPIEIVPLEVS